VANEENTPESSESRTGYGQTAYKRRLAYERLGLDPNMVQTAPFLRTNLRRIARCINQGRGERPVHPFSYLCSSEDPDAIKVAKLYLAVPESYRKLLPVEAYCQAAGVSPHRVLELLCFEHENSPEVQDSRCHLSLLLPGVPGLGSFVT
jgi:hypothetical protein